MASLSDFGLVDPDEKPSKKAAAVKAGPTLADYGLNDPDETPTAQKGKAQSPGALGYGEALLEAPAKMFLGYGARAGAMAGGAIAGQPFEQNVSESRDIGNRVTDWRAMDRTRGAEETLGHGFETAIQAAGAAPEVAMNDPNATMPFASTAAKIMGIPQPQQGQVAMPALRTGAEAGSELAMVGLGGMKARAMARARPTAPIAPKTAIEELGLVDPDNLPTGRTRPESDALYNPQALEPGKMEERQRAGTDMEGKPVFENLRQEEYDPAISSPLTERETFGTREPYREEGDNFDHAGMNKLADNSIEYTRPLVEEGPKNPDALARTKLSDSWNERLYNTLEQPDYEWLGAKKDSNRVRDGLMAIQESSKSPYYQELAKLLLSDEEFKPGYKTIEKYDKETTAGRYLVKTHEVTQRRNEVGSEALFLHETIHSYVFGAVEAFRQGKLPASMSHLEGPLKRMGLLYETLKGSNIGHQPNGDFVAHYGMKNLHEFVAEGFTNPDFQAALNQMKLPKGLRTTTLKTYWDSFVHAVHRLLGLEGKEPTYLSELLRTGADLMSGISKDERTHFAENLNPSHDLGMELEPMVKKAIEKKGVMGATIESVREHQLDKRPMEEFIKTELEGKQLQDMSPKDGSLMTRAYNRLGKLVKENLLQDTTIALMMKATNGTGALIKWTVDQVSRIDRDHMIKVKASIDEGLQPFRKMFWNKNQKADLAEMRDKWMENIGVKDLTRQDFKTEAQWNAYSAMQKVHDRVLGELNVKRAEHGLKPIEKIPSYFHSLWEGDYRVFGYDGLGNKKFAFGAKTEFEAMKVHKALEKKHPDLRWEQSEAVPDKFGLRDLSSFEDALRVMSKDDPVTKAIQKTYQEILQHRGFGRTGLHKKGVLGFLGSVGDLRHTERAFDQYVNQAYRYMGNLEKQKVLEDLQKIPLEQRKQLQQTMDFLHSYINKAKGARAEFDLVEQLSSAIGLGHSAPRNAIRGTAQIATLYWLTTPRFILSQMAQSANAIPKLLQDHGVVDGTKAFFEGWKNTVSPDAIAKEGAQWASDRGYLDPTIKNLLSKDINEAPTGSRVELLKEAAGWPAAWIEHNMVRLPAFLMFEKALRESVKDKGKRFEIAGEKADYYMVNYGRIHAPMIYDKMGLIGEAARPLKQYSHNYIGQFMEFASTAKNKGDYAPLAAFFGVQASVAGLKGMLYVAEATMAINAINYLFDTSVPTPEQLLLKSGLHDALIYGGMSTVLNTDISSSVAAPGLPSMLSLPAIEFPVGMMKDVGKFTLAYLKGEETDHDRLRAWLAITPTVAHEWLRNVYTPKGQPTVNPNDPQSRGNYRRTDYERVWTNLIGSKPLDEAKADALVRNVKKELVRDLQRKLNSVDAIVDRIQNGQQISPGLFQQYIKNGGDPSRLSQNIMQRMKERQLTGVERNFEGSPTPQQIHKLQIQRDYLERIAPSTDINRPMGVDPTTGEIRPIAQETGIGGKRLLNDTEGTAAQSRFGKKIDEYIGRWPQKEGGVDPENMATFESGGAGDVVRRPELRDNAKEFETSSKVRTTTRKLKKIKM